MMLTDEELSIIWARVTGDSRDFDGNIARAVIAENTKKVLANLKPDWWIAQCNDPDNSCFSADKEHAEGRVCDYGGTIDACYSADQVSALIQDRDALAARVKELEKPQQRGLVAKSKNASLTTEQRDTYWKQLERSGER